MPIPFDPLGWVAFDADDNATSTATKASPGGGSRHYITGVSGSYSGAGAAGKLMTLKQGTTELGRWYVTNQLSITFQRPIALDPATVANLELAASGTGGITGAATMTGYTI